MTAPVQGRRPGSRPASLTPRQTEVLQLASTGLTYQQTARALGIAENTVDVYMREIFKRLGAVNLPHAVLLACRAGILDGRPQRHGDHAGYTAHLRRRETPCWRCKQGESAYQSGRKAALKTA